VLWLVSINFILQGLFRRLVNILQKMIDCRQVSEGTETYQSTQDALEIARPGAHEGAVYTHRSRAVRGMRA